MHALSSWRIQSGSNGICRLKENYKHKLSRVTFAARRILALHIIAFVSYYTLARFRPLPLSRVSATSAWKPRFSESRNRATLGNDPFAINAFFIMTLLRQLFRDRDERNICAAGRAYIKVARSIILLSRWFHFACLFYIWAFKRVFFLTRWYESRQLCCLSLSHCFLSCLPFLPSLTASFCR